MEIIPQLISRYSVVLFAVCGLACAYFLLTGVASLREMKRAVFRLERNAVVSRAVSALLKAFVCVVIGGVIFAVTRMTPVPAATSLLNAATGTPSGIVIPTSVPTAVITSGQALMSGEFTPTITFVDASATGAPPATADPNQPAAPITTTALPEQPTATQLPPVTVTPEVQVAQPTQPLEMVADCSNPNAQISNPAPGEHITGLYAMRGTAAVPSGGWYKLEIYTPASGQWAFLVRGDTAVSAGVLMDNFSAANFAAGDYAINLTIVAADSSIQATCRIPIVLGS
jgi:hypothetical protein